MTEQAVQTNKRRPAMWKRKKKEKSSEETPEVALLDLEAFEAADDADRREMVRSFLIAARRNGEGGVGKS